MQVLVQDVTEFFGCFICGALLLLTTGLMEMSGLWSFSWTLRGMGGGFFVSSV